MKKNEYVAPEMEIVEMTGQCTILAGSEFDEKGPGTDWNDGGDGTVD